MTAGTTYYFQITAADDLDLRSYFARNNGVAPEWDIHLTSWLDGDPGFPDFFVGAGLSIRRYQDHATFSERLMPEVDHYFWGASRTVPNAGETEELAAKHYAPHVERPFYPGLVKYMTSAPIIAAVLEAPRVIEVSRTLMGATFGWKAEPGTIRGDFSSSTAYNLVHGSDSPEAAEKEIALFFSADEINDYERSLDGWLISEDDG